MATVETMHQHHPLRDFLEPALTFASAGGAGYLASIGTVVHVVGAVVLFFASCVSTWISLRRFLWERDDRRYRRLKGKP